MSFEYNAHQVVNLSLLIVGSTPQADYRRNYQLIPVIAPGLQNQAVIMLQGIQVIDDLEIVHIIDSSEVRQIIKLKPLLVL